jgi:hypothetical protein
VAAEVEAGRAVAVAAADLAAVAVGAAEAVAGAEAVEGVTEIAVIVAAVVVAGNCAVIGVEWILKRGSASRFPFLFLDSTAAETGRRLTH